jgi:hypothetical protein
MVAEVTIKTKSRKKLELVFDRYEQEFLQKVRGMIAHHGRAVAVKTKREIRHGDKSGRWYTYQGRAYQASAAGEVAAYRSGDLYRSIEQKISADGLTTEISTDVFYAPYLLNNDRKIFEPAFEDHTAMFISDLHKLIDREEI